MFLGICVGMQVLMERGHEFGTHEGLGLIKGESVHLSNLPKPIEECPHIGWSSVQFSNNNLFETNGEPAPHFYFNHSFACMPQDRTSTIASLAENDSLSVLIKQDNILGIQCHPEKSHVAGLRFLSQFAGMG
jgi:glutamine amidotransferase